MLYAKRWRRLLFREGGEEYESFHGNIKAIVDYAHNGAGFKTIISEMKQHYPSHRIVTVFGCPGGKGINRRSDVGLVAGSLSDMVYRTSDDPANENPMAICKQIASHAEKTNCPYEIVLDREQAIRKAIYNCQMPSVVLVLGKGCEKTQRTANGLETYISDAEVVKMAFGM